MCTAARRPTRRSWGGPDRDAQAWRGRDGRRANVHPVATLAQWIEGARPRTLPTAVSPVLVGTGAAIGAGIVAPGRALLALIVALALVVGVNYANDYSDGIRGTDDDRVGPLRLVGSAAAAPTAVRTAAIAALAVAALAGLTLVSLSRQWWLIGVGALCLAAAWFYTGGRRPYGYAGLGEVAVFVFFGPRGRARNGDHPGRLARSAGGRRRGRRRRARVCGAGRQQPARHPHRRRGGEAHAGRASSATATPVASTRRWWRRRSCCRDWPACAAGRCCSRCWPGRSPC